MLDHKKIIRNIYLFLPFTLLKQKLAFRLRKPPEGLPDFLCIGAQKAATTWLYDQLKLQPEIELADVKEVHYFDWFFHKPLQWYLKRFLPVKSKLRGEITPGYSIIEKGRVRFMRRIMPDLKIILMLRDPRERAWSAARFHFGTVLKRDLDTLTVNDYISYLQQPWVADRGNYIKIWTKWSAVFPSKQIHVIFQEDVRGNPETTLEEVCNFIGVHSVVNTGALHVLSNKSAEKEMPAEVRKYLDELYLPLIDQLEKLLKRDLSAWRNQRR